MEDIVAVAVTTDLGRVCYFLTWGRIQDAVDPGPVEEIVLRVAASHRTPGRPVSAEMCFSLQEASSAPYFYEYFLGFCQKRIPFGRSYRRWRRTMDRRMRDGHEIASVGPFE